MTEQALLDTAIAVSELHFWYGFTGGLFGFFLCHLTNVLFGLWWRRGSVED